MAEMKCHSFPAQEEAAEIVRSLRGFTHRQVAGNTGENA